MCKPTRFVAVRSEMKSLGTVSKRVHSIWTHKSLLMSLKFLYGPVFWVFRHTKLKVLISSIVHAKPHFQLITNISPNEPK
jgi:hypothetical protein